MSAVRMCDKDGTIFSENAEGWAVGTMSTSVRDERTGKTSMVQQTIDICPACNSAPVQAPAPQIAGVAEVERLSYTMGHNQD